MNQADYRDRTARLMHVILTCDEEAGEDGLCDCARSILEELCTAHANGLIEATARIGHVAKWDGYGDTVARLQGMEKRLLKRVHELDPQREEREAAERELEADS